ncbi:unnamed protein product [Cylicocyclus nassatus]|uniref:Uncharacterized protein n=1 Tax=Cylicocyclus nassatus TaxID=53992 RepID=A0AA36M8L6_CYLNA|nr:unnamed protein product [Cylicocyclus nassatus]
MSFKEDSWFGSFGDRPRLEVLPRQQCGDTCQECDADGLLARGSKIRKSTIAGVGFKKGKKKRTTKAVEEDGDWNKYETHPDKQLGPTNVNPNMGAEIVIPRNGK